MPRDIRMLQNRFQFGTEIKVAAMLAVVQRLDPDSVARQYQPLARLAPQRQGKHSAQSRQARRVQFPKRGQYRLRIALRAEPMPARNELLPDFAVIVDFPVEDERSIAVLAHHRLVAASEVDDLQPNSAQRRLTACEDAVLIRPPMVQRLGDAPCDVPVRTFPQVRKPRNSTHSPYPRLSFNKRSLTCRDPIYRSVCD